MFLLLNTAIIIMLNKFLGSKCSAAKKNFLTRHRRELGFVLLAPLLSIYRPIRHLKVLKVHIFAKIYDFLISI